MFVVRAFDSLAGAQCKASYRRCIHCTECNCNERCISSCDLDTLTPQMCACHFSCICALYMYILWRDWILNANGIVVCAIQIKYIRSVLCSLLFYTVVRCGSGFGSVSYCLHVHIYTYIHILYMDTCMRAVYMGEKFSIPVAVVHILYILVLVFWLAKFLHYTTTHWRLGFTDCTPCIQTNQLT